MSYILSQPGCRIEEYESNLPTDHADWINAMVMGGRETSFFNNLKFLVIQRPEYRATRAGLR
jgi:hypothetical protein